MAISYGDWRCLFEDQNERVISQLFTCERGANGKKTERKQGVGLSLWTNESHDLCTRLSIISAPV